MFSIKLPMMKTIAGAALISVLAASVPAAEFPQVTMHGTLIDLNCYARNVALNTGVEATDAEACGTAADMNPVALIVTTGGEVAVFAIASPPMFLFEHLGREARITGEQRVTETQRAPVIKPQRIEVSVDGEWREVQLLPEM